MHSRSVELIKNIIGNDPGGAKQEHELLIERRQTRDGLDVAQQWRQIVQLIIGHLPDADDRLHRKRDRSFAIADGDQPVALPGWPSNSRAASMTAVGAPRMTEKPQTMGGQPATLSIGSTRMVSTTCCIGSAKW